MNDKTKQYQSNNKEMSLSGSQLFRVGEPQNKWNVNLVAHLLCLQHS